MRNVYAAKISSLAARAAIPYDTKENCFVSSARRLTATT
jgi:hypothetical protein